MNNVFADLESAKDEAKHDEERKLILKNNNKQIVAPRWVGKPAKHTFNMFSLKQRLYIN